MKNLVIALITITSSLFFYSCEQEEVLPVGDPLEEIGSLASNTNISGVVTPLALVKSSTNRGGSCGTCSYYEGYISATEVRPYDRSVTVSYNSFSKDLYNNVIQSSFKFVAQTTFIIKAGQKLSANKAILSSVSENFSHVEFKVSDVTAANPQFQSLDSGRDLKDFGAMRSCSVTCTGNSNGGGGRIKFDVLKPGNDGGPADPGEPTGPGFE